MSETYTLVGNDSSWIVALMPVPAIIVYAIKRRKTGQPFSVLTLIPVAFFFVAALVGFPMEWILAGACIGTGIGFQFFPKIGAPWKRFAMGGAFFVIGCVYLSICRIEYSRLVLEDSGVKFDWIGRHDAVPRSGLRINVVGPQRMPWDIRSWGSWTSFHGREVGPSITGFSYYWGPHGLIRGDALGERLAQWANVKPSYQRPPSLDQVIGSVRSGT
jgi:hypothetical protein